jgi:hypothetical protein
MQSVIRKETQGVTENAGSLELKKPDEVFRIRNAAVQPPTERMSLRTKAPNPGTARPGVARARGVRPLEFYFLGGAVLLAATLAAFAPAPTPAASSFAATVRPILKSRCAPCHEPRGQMYVKLPFDDPAVVAAHGEKVLRRLKADDRAAVEAWLKTLPAEGKPDADQAHR